MRRSILVIFFALSVAVSPVTAEDAHFVQASSEGAFHVDATLAAVVLSVQADAPSAKAASQSAAERASQVLSWLKTSQVDKLKTQGISLYPQYNYSGGQNRLVGYQAVHTISFSAPIPKAGSIIDEAIDKGATRIDSISFSAEDDVLAAARLKAIDAAALSAKEQAERALKALGISSKGVLELTVNAQNVFLPHPMQPQMLRTAELASPVSTPVEGGQLSVTAHVTVKLEF